MIRCSMILSEKPWEKWPTMRLRESLTYPSTKQSSLNPNRKQSKIMQCSSKLQPNTSAVSTQSGLSWKPLVIEGWSRQLTNWRDKRQIFKRRPWTWEICVRLSIQISASTTAIYVRSQVLSNRNLTRPSWQQTPHHSPACIKQTASQKSGSLLKAHSQDQQSMI